MALDQYVRLTSRQPADVGFYYEGIPEAGIALGVFSYRFPVTVTVSQCTLHCDTPALTPQQVYLTLDNVVVATGYFNGGETTGWYSPTGANTLGPSTYTVRLISPNPADEELSGVRTTIAATRAANSEEA